MGRDPSHCPRLSSLSVQPGLGHSRDAGAATAALGTVPGYLGACPPCQDVPPHTFLSGCDRQHTSQGVPRTPHGVSPGHQTPQPDRTLGSPFPEQLRITHQPWQAKAAWFHRRGWSSSGISWPLAQAVSTSSQHKCVMNMSESGTAFNLWMMAQGTQCGTCSGFAPCLPVPS